MKKKISKVINGFMVAATSVTTVGGVLATVPVQAAEPTNQTRNSGDYMVNNGVVDFGKGTANITIKGNAGQSLVGKRFEVFQLFNAENAKGGESINYTFKDEYATALKTVVASALNKRDGSSLKAADVTEYMVIDYIQTLNHDQVEGAQTTQELEGRYSAFRYFVENVRTEIKNEGLSGDYVYVQGTAADNSVTLQGLQYGYYMMKKTVIILHLLFAWSIQQTRQLLLISNPIIHQSSRRSKKMITRIQLEMRGGMTSLIMKSDRQFRTNMSLQSAI